MSQAASTKTNAIIQPAFIPATSFVWPHTSMIVRKSHKVSHSIVIRAFLSDKAGGSSIPLMTNGKRIIDNPNIVGTDQSINSFELYILSTKKNIKSRAKTPQIMHLVSFFCCAISGTTVIAATRSIDAVTTAKVFKPPPFDRHTMNVMSIGISSNPAIMTPVL